MQYEWTRCRFSMAVTISIICLRLFRVQCANYNATVTFACISSETQQSFIFIDVKSDQNYSVALEEVFKTQRSFSFLILGYESSINRNKSGGTFITAKEWHKNSNSNVCVVDYRYLSLARFLPFYFKTVWKRVPYVVKVIVQFLKKLKQIKIINSFRKVRIVGFSLGGQIAGLVGREFITEDELIEMILALDPARTGIEKNPETHVRSKDAAHVQVIYTSAFLGTRNCVGDSNIIVDGGVVQRHCKLTFNPLCSHVASLDIHEITVKKMWKFVASKTKYIDAKHQCRRINSNSAQNDQLNFLGNDECVVGILSEEHERKNGTFYLSMDKGILPLRKKTSRAIFHFLKSKKSADGTK